MNDILAKNVLQELLDMGVREFCVCPGGRNAPFCFLLAQNEHIKTYYWHDERAAAFFALGRSRFTKKPVAVIVTSGTAAGEMLPAAMEAYYSGIPIALVTADRPRILRNTGAPQTAEQVGIYGLYADFLQDIEGNEPINFKMWQKKGPCHINVCFDEPASSQEKQQLHLRSTNEISKKPPSRKAFEEFLQRIEKPLVILSTLKEEAKLKVKNFLLELNAPVYLEGISNLREDPDLLPLCCYYPDVKNFDSIIRIGGIPTHRIWRDLETVRLPLFSLSEMPFKGLHYGEIEQVCFLDFFSDYQPKKRFSFEKEAFAKNAAFAANLLELIHHEPYAEPSLIHSLSLKIPKYSHIYLGNSMPIRNWDVAATYNDRHFSITATRGLNGIDGQLSFFLGLSQPDCGNWAILGDLTTLYDLSAPWILSQLDAKEIKIVILNNYGGSIFARKFTEKKLQNSHNIHFEHFAKIWNLHYEASEGIPDLQKLPKQAVLELVSCPEATERFWERYHVLQSEIYAC